MWPYLKVQLQEEEGPANPPLNCSLPALPRPPPERVPLATHEFTHRTTMFFHRFRVPTTFTMQTFLGLRESPFSSSAEREPVTSRGDLDWQPHRRPARTGPGFQDGKCIHVDTNSEGQICPRGLREPSAYLFWEPGHPQINTLHCRTK